MRFFTPIFFAAVVFPMITLAQAPTSLKGIMELVVGLINLFIPVLFAVALVALLWGGAVVLLNAGDEAQLKSGKLFLVWGIIGLFVMVSVWGLVNVITGTFF